MEIKFESSFPQILISVPKKERKTDFKDKNLWKFSKSFQSYFLSFFKKHKSERGKEKKILYLKKHKGERGEIFVFLVVVKNIKSKRKILRLSPSRHFFSFFVRKKGRPLHPLNENEKKNTFFLGGEICKKNNLRKTKK